MIISSSATALLLVCEANLLFSQISASSIRRAPCKLSAIKSIALESFTSKVYIKHIVSALFLFYCLSACTNVDHIKRTQDISVAREFERRYLMALRWCASATVGFASEYQCQEDELTRHWIKLGAEPGKVAIYYSVLAVVASQLTSGGIDHNTAAALEKLATTAILHHIRANSKFWPVTVEVKAEEQRLIAAGTMQQWGRDWLLRPVPDLGDSSGYTPK